MEKDKRNPKRLEGFLEAFNKIMVPIFNLIKSLEANKDKGEICEQIIEPNLEHGYDHYGDIATTLSLSYNHLELIDTYQNDVCPEEFCKTIVTDVLEIAQLGAYLKVDAKDTDNLLENIFQALVDYASANNFHCGGDFIPLFNELKVKYTEK